MEDLKATWQGVCEFVQGQMKRLGVPGVAIGVYYRGEEFAAGFGVTNVDNPLPVTDTTLFQIGSNTKTFTGTAVMRFVDQGKISLSDPIRKYLPQFETADPDIAPKVTVRHMLNHMSGWDGDLFSDTGEGSDALDKYIAKIKGQAQLAPMDTVWSYNNSGFTVLGRIMELVGGKSWEELIKEMVLVPLGLKNTFLDPWDVMTYRYACGHMVTPEGPRVGRPWRLPRGIGPAGKMTSDVHDMLAYARFHMGEGRAPNGERLMSTDTLYRMRTPDCVLFGELKWALPFCVDDTLGPRQVMHGGGTVGQISEFRFIPELGFALVILTNADVGGRLNGKTRIHIYKEFLGLEEKELKASPAKPEELAEFVGTYSRTAGDFIIGQVAGQLAGVMVSKLGFPDETVPVAPPSPPIPMGMAGKDLLTFTFGPMEGGPVHVIRKADGKVGWLRIGHRIMKKVE